MVRFQKLTRNLFLTLHGHNLHRQQQQISKFLMRYQQFASHAYCGASFQDGVAAVRGVFRFPNLWLQCSVSFVHGLERTHLTSRQCSSVAIPTELPCPLYLLTPWCRVLLEKLTGFQLVKKFPAFHGTRMFITALTSVRHLSLSWASPIQYIYPHSTSWRSILILSTHLRLGLPSSLLPSGFPTKTLYTPLSSPIRATCPAHPILLEFVTRTILG